MSVEERKLQEENRGVDAGPSLSSADHDDDLPSPLSKPSRDRWDSMLFFQKIQWYGHQLSKEYAPYVDKIQAKEKARRLCPSLRVAHVFWVFSAEDLLEEITEEEWYVIMNDCDQCMLKATHGCGWNLLVDARTSLTTIRNCVRQWTRPYSVSERQYTFLSPTFFLEEVIDCFYHGPTGQAVDIKVMCLHSQPVFLLLERNEESIYMDISWSRVLQRYSHVPSSTPLPTTTIPQRPPRLEEILQYAQCLSKPFECVRVDFYLSKQQDIYFGEFTFTHAGGTQRLIDEEERAIGQLWKHHAHSET